MWRYIYYADKIFIKKKEKLKFLKKQTKQLFSAKRKKLDPG